MTNLEKYKDEIFEILKTTTKIAVKHDNKVVSCFGTPCSECKLNINGGDCRKVWKEWANAKYVEPKVFTEAEKAIFRACEKLKYAARDIGDDLYFYTDKPEYDDSSKSWQGPSYVNSYLLTDEPFNAIKVEDKEPTSREEILGIWEENNGN